MAKRLSSVTCPVKALVDATPISGPTCRYDTASVRRAMLEPTALTKLYVKMPCSFTNSMAAKVSAVSPDCEMAITISSGNKTGLRYLNSEAYSTSTVMRAKFSNKYLATKPACHDVPQAVIIIRRAFKNLSMCGNNSSNKMLYCRSSRAFIMLRKTLGCS